MEFLRAFAIFCEKPEPAHAAISAALGLPETLPSASDFTSVFLMQCWPYASIYLGAEGQMGGDARDRIAGFWRAIGGEPPAEPDHLAVLMGLYAEIAEREAAARGESKAGNDAGEEWAAWRRMRVALLWEHIASWLPPYLAAVESVGGPFYAAWAVAFRNALAAEIREISAAEWPRELPLHFRSESGDAGESVGMADPRVAGPDAFLSSLLAPIRSGLILTHADVADLARHLNLAARVAERKFALRALLDQDAPGTLSALADFADEWAARHSTLGMPEPIAAAWQARARATAALCRALFSDARTVS